MLDDPEFETTESEDGNDDGGEAEEDAGLEVHQDQEIVVETPLELFPSAQAQIAFQDYKNLGAARSITALHNHYLVQRQKDPNAPIPTDNIYVLGQWEAMYNWKAMAWEHDAESNRAFDQNRRKILTSLYEGQNKRAEKLLRIAEKAMDQLEADIDSGNVVLSPQDALRFLQEGTKTNREAQDAILRLQDPREQSDQGGSDFFDAIRKMGLLQINQQINNYGGAS